MANPFGTPWEGKPLEYRSDIPLDLVNRGLAVAQGRTDAMQQQVQGYLDNLGNTQFYKDSDRELVNQKINETVNSLNSFAGPDLTNGRTHNQLMNVVSGLSNDPQVLDRIMANRNAGRQLQRIQSIKDKHPEQYSGVNESYFMKQFNQWRSNPDKTSFDATYQPFNDYNSDMMSSMKTTLDNPDIQDQINYTTDPATGKRIPRLYHGVGSMTSVKEVATQKLYEGIMGGWTGANDSQLQLEYNNAMSDNGSSIALGHVAFLAQDYSNRAKLYDNLISQGKAKGVDTKDYENKRDEFNAKVALAVDAAGKISRKELDPHDVVSYDQYRHDKLWSAAEAHAYKQEGKTEWNPVDLAILKHRMDQEDIRETARLKNTKPVDPTVVPNTHLANVVEGVYGPNGKAQADVPVFKALMGASDRPTDKNGYTTVAFSNAPVFASLAPIISKIIPEADQKSQYGYTKFNNDFATWKQMQVSKGAYQTYTAPDSNGYQWPTSTHALGEHRVQDLTPKDYIDILKQTPGAVDIYKSQYGMDLNDPKVLDNTSKVNQMVILAAGQGQNRSTMLNITGNLPLTPIGGDNVVRDSGGRPVASAISAPMTAAQLWPVLGNGDVELGKRLFDLYSGQGSIRQDHVNTDYVKDGKIDGTRNYYTFAVHVPVNQDIRSVAGDYVRDATTAGVYKDSGPDIVNDVVNKYQNGVRRSQYTPAMMTHIADELTAAKPAQKEKITALLDIANNPALDDKVRGEAQDILNAAHAALSAKTK